MRHAAGIVDRLLAGLLAGLLACLLAGIVHAAGPGDTGATGSRARDLRYETILDSLRTDSDSLFRWNAAASQVGWADADTGLWRPDVEGVTPSRTRAVSVKVVPELFGHTKVDGVTYGAGLRTRVFRGPYVRTSASALRALSRGQWMGEASVLFSRRSLKFAYPRALRARFSGGVAPDLGFPDPGSRRFGWGIIGGWSDRSVVFGSERTFAGSLQSSLLGIDGQSYLDRSETYGGWIFQHQTARYGGGLLELEIVYARSEDAALQTAHDPILNTDPRLWPNARASRRTTGGPVLWAQWGGDLVSTGTRARLRLASRGADVGAGHDVPPAAAQLLHRRAAPAAESLDLEVWAGAVGGGRDLAPQDAADLGGASSLRAYPPRTRAGAAQVFGRIDYVFAKDPLRRLDLPILRSLRLQPVLFADAGAVWSPQRPLAGPTRAWRDLDTLRAPRSGDWLFDWGLGIQRNLGFPGLLGRARLDFAVRTDRADDRLRVSFSLSP